MRLSHLAKSLSLTALVSIYVGLLIEGQKKSWGIAGWFDRQAIFA
jgi:hypothetical protein